MIKLFKLCYNILLCDDKSYLYIYLFGGEDYFWLVFYCGVCNLFGCFFGLYLSIYVVCESFNLM